MCRQWSSQKHEHNDEANAVIRVNPEHMGRSQLDCRVRTGTQRNLCWAAATAALSYLFYLSHCLCSYPSYALSKIKEINLNTKGKNYYTVIIYA